LPDMKVLRTLFTPDIQALPSVLVSQAPLSDYDELLALFVGEAA